MRLRPHVRAHRLRASWRQGAAALALAWGCVGVPTALAGPPPWPEAAFTYYAEAKPLKTVLGEFAAGFSLSLDLPAGFDTLLVSGRFNAKSPTEFIDRLSGVYGFTWFTHAGTLFIAHNKDLQVRAIPTAVVGSGTNLRQVLTDLRVLDARFGWGELPDQGVVVVSGPPAYVRLVESTVASLPKVPGGLQVAVFRLRHASVEDRSISYRDREITTPGVANILRNLVSGNTAAMPVRLGSAAGLVLGLNPFMATSPSGAEASRASGGSGGANAASAASTSAAAGTAGTSRVRPSIQSDPRINALIIQDAPERMPIYRQLIAALDVPTPLIEIEAMIIDVNTSRLQELGISWNAVGLNGGVALGFGNINQAVDRNTISMFVGPNGSGANPSTVITNASNYFISRLRLLEQQGDASIQARPSILTTENVGAVIDLSETVYIQTTSERTALVTPVTAGTTLRVTPRLVGDGPEAPVRLYVDIEDGQIQSATNAGTLPSVRRGVVSTEASVRKDESLLIGGYNSVHTVKGKDKIPILGDVPLVGLLFSSAADQVQRRERLFLIRTRVVGQAGPAQAAADPQDLLAMPAAGAVATATEAPRPAAATPLPVTTAGSMPASRPIPGGQPLTEQMQRLTPLSAGSPVAAINPGSSGLAGSAGAAPTDTAAQSERERRARRVLEQELAKAEDKLKQLRDRLSRGFDTSKPEERSAATETRAAAARALADVESLRKELARSPGP